MHKVIAAQKLTSLNQELLDFLEGRVALSDHSFRELSIDLMNYGTRLFLYPLSCLRHTCTGKDTEIEGLQRDVLNPFFSGVFIALYGLLKMLDYAYLIGKEVTYEKDKGTDLLKVFQILIIALPLICGGVNVRNCSSRNVKADKLSDDGLDKGLQMIQRTLTAPLTGFSKFQDEFYGHFPKGLMLFYWAGYFFLTPFDKGLAAFMRMIDKKFVGGKYPDQLDAAKTLVRRLEIECQKKERNWEYLERILLKVLGIYQKLDETHRPGDKGLRGESNIMCVLKDGMFNAMHDLETDFKKALESELKGNNQFPKQIIPAISACAEFLNRHNEGLSLEGERVLTIITGYGAADESRFWSLIRALRVLFYDPLALFYVFWTLIAPREYYWSVLFLGWMFNSEGN